MIWERIALRLFVPNIIISLIEENTWNINRK